MKQIRQKKHIKNIPESFVPSTYIPFAFCKLMKEEKRLLKLKGSADRTTNQY